MSTIPNIICKECHKTFIPKITGMTRFKDKKFCSRLCYWIFSKKHLNEGTFKKGQRVFVPLESRKRGAENNMWRGGQIKKTCLICSIDFFVDKYRMKAKCCSKDCDLLYRKTEEYRLYLSEVQRSNISDELKQIHLTIGKLAYLLRRHPKYDFWRDRVLKRDSFICQMCGIRGGKLQVDHIEAFSVLIMRNKITSFTEALLCKDLWNDDNGRTLCVPCHYETPTFGSKVLSLLINKKNL